MLSPWMAKTPDALPISGLQWPAVMFTMWPAPSVPLKPSEQRSAWSGATAA